VDMAPDELQQQRIAALGITINQFQKTLQGRAIIERQELFVLAGMLYQGYNQKAIETVEDQCSDEEIAGCHDIDGTRHRVIDTRRRRLAGMANAKQREMAGRRKLTIAQERDELELMLLKRQVAALEPETEPESEPETEPETAETHACVSCGKQFGTFRKLNAHKMGSKHL